MKIDTYLRRKNSDIPISVRDFDPNHNYSIFLYGRSGSGKTHTCNEILTSMQFERARFDLIEIYMNKKSNLESGNYERLKILEKIKNARRERETHANKTSSRNTLIIKINNVVIIDLMGSEKPNDRNGILNNQSLLALGNLVRALLYNTRPNWRESVLNQILKDCLEKSFVIFIGCLTDIENDSENKKTIDFMNSISKINYNVNYRSDTESNFSVESYNESIDKTKELIENAIAKLQNKSRLL